ncbi:MAG: tetratricopeptide repeat protein [Pyrinomonadaceae bacterium]
MRYSKVTCLVCACALAFSSLTSLNASSLASAEVIGEKIAPAPECLIVTEQMTIDNGEIQLEDAPVRAKKRPNLFVRVITAPFRGLARLFGGSKNDQAAGVRAKEKQKTGAQTARPSELVSVPNNESAQPGTRSAQAIETATTQLARGRQTVLTTPPMIAPRPRAADSNTSFDYEPRPFTPFIEGVPGDPLSQGRALLENGYTNEAIAELSVAAVAGPDLVEANNLLGLAYDRRGQHKQAQEYYERALSVAPQNARALNNLGHSLYLDDRYKDSLARLKAAARLAPADAQVANNLALVYGRLGKYDEAFRQFKRAGSEFYARMSTAALLAGAGRDREAIKHYEAARKLDPASPDVLRQLITLYVRTGQRDKAEAAERALDKKSDKPAVSIIS